MANERDVLRANYFQGILRKVTKKLHIDYPPREIDDILPPGLVDKMTGFSDESKILRAAALLRVLPEVVDPEKPHKPRAYILQVPESEDVYFSEDLKYRPKEVHQFAMAKVVDNKEVEELRKDLPYWGVATGSGYRKKRSRKRTKRASKRRSKRVRRKTRRRKKSKRRR